MLDQPFAKPGRRSRPATGRIGWAALLLWGVLSAVAPSMLVANTIAEVGVNDHVEDRELITAFIALVGLVTLIINRQQFASHAHVRWLMSAYIAFVGGSVLTVTEVFFLSDVQNALEHAAYATASVLLLIYCGHVARPREQANP